MDQIAYCRTHLPRCLSGFSVILTELPGWRFDGHGSLSDLKAKFPGIQIEAPEHINTVFTVWCQCGSDKHHVLAHAWSKQQSPDNFVFLSSIALQCVSCKTSTELIDTAVHGYDAELGNGSATMRGEGNREVVECGGCDLNKELQVFVRFEYPDDLLGDNFKRFAGRQQDLFTWVSLLGKCTKCSSLLRIADYECA